VTAYDDGVLALLGDALDGFWPCDEASGNLTDDSGGGWTFTATGSSTYQASGPTIDGVAQHAVQFSGTSYFSTSGSFPTASAANGRCEAVWVFLPSTSSAAADILTRSATNQNEFRIRHDSSGGAIAPHYQSDGATVIANPGGADIDGGAWHLVIGWWDPADDDVYVQVDNATPVSALGTTDIKTDSTVGLGLGATASGGAALRSGSRVSNAMLFNRVLTADERTALFTGAFTVFHIVSPTDDITTTGWTSTPLWSKVDEDPASPDGTVIQATAA
jgi:hypothetical protein